MHISTDSGVCCCKSEQPWCGTVGEWSSTKWTRFPGVHLPLSYWLWSAAGGGEPTHVLYKTWLIFNPPLYQVCGERGDMVFLIVVMVEASGPSPSVYGTIALESMYTALLLGACVVPSHPSPVPFCFACSIDFYTVDITASWNVYSGKALLTVASSPGHSPPGGSGLGMRLCWQWHSVMAHCCLLEPIETAFQAPMLHEFYSGMKGQEPQRKGGEYKLPVANSTMGHTLCIWPCWTSLWPSPGHT